MNSHKLTRRNFLTGGLAVGGLAAMGSLTACSPQAQAPKQSENLADTSTPAAAAPESAEDWLDQAPTYADEDCAEIIDTEVVVVGAGCSGLFAACHAAEAGAKVLLIEGNEKGNGIRSSALGAIGTRLMNKAGVSVDKEELINDVAHYALNQCNIELIRQWVENSGEAVDWYEDMVVPEGYAVCPEYRMPNGETRYKMWPTGHGTAPAEDTTQRISDPDLIPIFTSHIESLGGAYRNNTRMKCLIKEGDAVVGLFAETTDDDILRINASKGVIVATGGYVNNEEMFRARLSHILKGISGGLNHGSAFGEGIKSCLWAGARLEDVSTAMIFDRGVVKPDTELGHLFDGGDFSHFTFSTQPFLKVSKKGTRLTNESSPYDFIMHTACQRADSAWYPIWDSSWQEDVTRFETIGCSTLFLREGGNNRPDSLEHTAQQMEEMVESGYIIKADTIRELGEKLLLDDVDAFEYEVANYNKMYQEGYDSQYGKDFFRMSAIDEPPFYGMRVGGEPLCTLDGIVVNTNHQALDEDDNPIPGLFVVGNDGGGFYAGTYPNFGAGTNAGRISTNGMMCGRYVASL